MIYDVIIVGAGPGGIFTAYELLQKKADLKIAVFELGQVGCRTVASQSADRNAGGI